MANPIDRMVAWFSPEKGLRRHAARKALAYYESARPTRQRKAARERGSADTSILRAGTSLREQARHLEENHDLAKGILDILVQNVVGPSGIGIEPMPRRHDGTIHQELARQILALHRDWSRRPEVTWQHDWPSSQRLVARSMFRDGEGLAQQLTGRVANLSHGTRIPSSLELAEADLLPMDYNDPGRRIVMGVEQNTWGRPVRYHLYKEHPGNMHSPHYRAADMKPVPASRILHPKLVQRIRQTRGVSVFATVLSRLEDLKDYEESERIAAKVAASMAAYIKKGDSGLYDGQGEEEEPRDLRFRPGMVFDDLEPGEEIGTIDTTRPNTSLEAHRRGQQRALAAGTGVTYSSSAKDYDGSYSSQRQELVEGWGAYGVLANEFISQFVQPVHETNVRAALASGLLTLPDDVDPETVTEALYIPPQMPWIDPDKESRSHERLEQSVYASGPEIIRKRGQNPHDVLEQEKAWRQRLQEAGLTSTAAPEPEPESEEPDHDRDAQPSARRRPGRSRG